MDDNRPGEVIKMALEIKIVTPYLSNHKNEFQVVKIKLGRLFSFYKITKCCHN